jgi:hypothetical protein
MGNNVSSSKMDRRGAIKRIAELELLPGLPTAWPDDNKGERFVAVLEIPPVDSPKTAVKMSIYSDIKNNPKRKL